MDAPKLRKRRIMWRSLDETRLSREERMLLIERVVERLARVGLNGVPDSNRTGATKEMGIMNSFAWRGW